MKSAIIIAVTLTFSFFSLLMTGQEKNENDSYRDFVKQRNKEFTEWREKANAEFVEYLSQAWVEFHVHLGRKDPVGAVPDKPTYYFPDDSISHASHRRHGIPAPEIISPTVAPSDVILARYVPEETIVSVNFFGIDISIPFDYGMKLNHTGAKENDVAAGWKKMSGTSYLPTVETISEICTRLSLSDWATYVLVKHISEAVYSEDYTNERILTQMFLLCQLEYKVRIGAAANRLVIMLPIDESVYQVQYISDGKDELYIFGYDRISNDTPLYSYPFGKDFSSADRKISLTVNKSMTMGIDSYQKISVPLWTSILGEDFIVPVSQPFVFFALDYPQTDLTTYHRSVVDKETGRAIFRAVKYKILKEGMNQEQAVAFILNLVQKGFEYKTDYEMFGRTKPLFIEESFYYGTNNCKDRVLIFSWIVKNTLDLKTVMLEYPGHVACGVEFNQPVEGDGFLCNGKKYIMCDPTYIGAPIGATMPKFLGVAPNFIEL